MSDDAEWGPWVEHDGKGCPLPVGIEVNGVEADGSNWIGVVIGYPDQFDEDDVNVWDWEHCQMQGCWDWRLVRYRIRKSRALRDLIEIAASPYAPPPVIGPEGPVREPACQPEGVPA